MAITYNGITFSGSNTSQNIAYNGATLCSVNAKTYIQNLGMSMVPMYTRSCWIRATDWDDDYFHACIYRIDSDGEIYVCWWTNPSADHYLSHPGYSLATNCLYLCYSYYMHAYGETSGDQPIIIIQGTSGECESCICCYTLSTSQWNPQKSWCCLCRGPYPSATCTRLGYLISCCSGTFSFYFRDRSVGRCWYYGRGGCEATSCSVAEYCIDDIGFRNTLLNGVLAGCYIGRDFTTINA